MTLSVRILSVGILALAVGAGLLAALDRRTAPAANPVEVGKVAWGRDFDAAQAEAKASGKPMLVLFQEVPGCKGCQKFGREVMSDPTIVKAIQENFTAVLVCNNHPGKDAEVLKRFGEPAWNYQVVRFLNAEGRDLIPREDQVWTVPALSARMVKALEAAGRPVPAELRGEQPAISDSAAAPP
jgi:Thioredoxin-like